VLGSTPGWSCIFAIPRPLLLLALPITTFVFPEDANHVALLVDVIVGGPGRRQFLQLQGIQCNVVDSEYAPQPRDVLIFLSLIVLLVLDVLVSPAAFHDVMEIELLAVNLANPTHHAVPISPALDDLNTSQNRRVLGKQKRIKQFPIQRKFFLALLWIVRLKVRMVVCHADTSIISTLSIRRSIRCLCQQRLCISVRWPMCCTNSTTVVLLQTISEHFKSRNPDLKVRNLVRADL
jgi:hypothetical protein